MRVKTVYTEITNKCNLNCRSCYNRSGLNNERREITKEQLTGIIELFIVYGLNRFLISGGEPTLHSEFDAVLDLIDEYPQLSFGIVTNGTVHNRKLIETLNNRRNFNVQISLDGSCEKQNAKTRGAGHFQSAVEFAKKIHNPDMKPLLKMVISQSNYDDIENFYRLAESLYCIPEYTFIYKSGNGEYCWEDKCLSAQQKLKALKMIDELNHEFHTEASLPLCTSKCPYADNVENLSLCVKADGSIQPCQMLYSANYFLGNVFDFDKDSFLERLTYISSLAKARLDIDFSCGKCMLKEVCGKGCMADAFNLNGDPLADDGDCDFRKLQFIGYQLGMTGER